MSVVQFRPWAPLLGAGETIKRVRSIPGAASLESAAEVYGTLWLHYPVDMTREELLARIWIDPKRCFGKPCIRGHRIWVSLILDLLASGTTVAEILADYPDLEEADIQACIAYGAEMSRERYVNIRLEPAA